MRSLPLEETIAIYEAQVSCAAFCAATEPWVEYFSFLKANNMQLEAGRVYERAIAAAADKRSILAQCANSSQ